MAYAVECVVDARGFMKFYFLLIIFGDLIRLGNCAGLIWETFILGYSITVGRMLVFMISVVSVDTTSDGGGTVWRGMDGRGALKCSSFNQDVASYQLQ